MASMSEEEKKKHQKQKERKDFRAEREFVAHQFYEKVRQLILGSDVARL